MEKRNSEVEHGQPKRLVLHVRFECGSLSITTAVSLLANAFRVFEAYCTEAVKQICVIHEAMNGCENLKIHCRLASKM